MPGGRAGRLPAQDLGRAVAALERRRGAAYPARVEIRHRCVELPNSHQAMLLQRLGLHLPESLPIHDLWWRERGLSSGIQAQRGRICPTNCGTWASGRRSVASEKAGFLEVRLED